MSLAISPTGTFLLAAFHGILFQPHTWALSPTYLLRPHPSLLFSSCVSESGRNAGPGSSPPSAALMCYHCLLDAGDIASLIYFSPLYGICFFSVTFWEFSVIIIFFRCFLPRFPLSFWHSSYQHVDPLLLSYFPFFKTYFRRSNCCFLLGGFLDLVFCL